MDDFDPRTTHRPWRILSSLSLDTGRNYLLFGRYGVRVDDAESNILFAAGPLSSRSVEKASSFSRGEDFIMPFIGGVVPDFAERTAYGALRGFFHVDHVALPRTRSVWDIYGMRDGELVSYRAPVTPFAPEDLNHLRLEELASLIERAKPAFR